MIQVCKQRTIEDLKIIQRNAKSFVWLHEGCADLYEARNKLTAKLVSVGTFVLSTIAITFLTADSAKIFLYIFQSLNILLGIIGLLSRREEYITRIMNHRFLVGKNHSLINRIDEIMHQHRMKKAVFLSVYQQVITENNEIMENRATHRIHHKIWKRYNRTFGARAPSYIELFQIDTISKSPTDCCNESSGGNSGSSRSSSHSDSIRNETNNRIYNIDTIELVDLHRVFIVSEEEKNIEIDCLKSLEESRES